MSDISDALEDARQGQPASGMMSPAQKPIAYERARSLVYNFLRNVPDGMTVRELCDELYDDGAR